MNARSRQLIDFVRSLIASEADRGWERLKRTPSTFTWRCLDYLGSLPSDRQASLLDAFAERAPSLLGVEPLCTQLQNHELGRFYEEVLQEPSRLYPPGFCVTCWPRRGSMAPWVPSPSCPMRSSSG